MATDPADATGQEAEAAIETPIATNLPAPRKAELVASEGVGYIVPRTMDEAYRYAVAVCQAGLAPNSYQKDPKDWNSPPDPSKVMLGIAAAMEAGLPPMFGLRNIAIIQGRPTIWGDAGVALVQRAGLISDQTVSEIGTSHPKGANLAEWPDDFGIAVSLWRKGQAHPYIGRFTVGDAKRAKLWMNPKKTPWIEHPIRMLTARARTWALRDGFADALAGLSIREEVEDMMDVKPVIDSAAMLSDEPAEAADGDNS